MAYYTDFPNKEDSIAAVLLAQLTRRQLDMIIDFIHAHGSAVYEAVAEQRRSMATPPLLALVDTPALDAYDTKAILTTMTVMISDDLAAPNTDSSYRTALVRGMGMDPTTAENLTNGVTTEDQAHHATAERIFEALPDLPVISDPDIRRGIISMITQASALKTGWFGDTISWKDNLYEFLKLGRVIMNEMKREALQGVGYAYLAAGPGLAQEQGDPFISSAGSYMGRDVGTSINNMLGMTVMPESGDPWPGGSDDDRDTVARFNDMMLQSSALRSPYVKYAMVKPEEGGLFSSIGHFLKKAAGTVVHALPAITGTVLGGALSELGPLGTAAGAAVGSALGKGVEHLVEGHPAPSAGHTPHPKVSIHKAHKQHKQKNKQKTHHKTQPAEGTAGVIRDVVQLLAHDLQP